ncbi:ABC transporter substrate-binding protein [Clostridium tyrobutyricum]|uniref:ABC transporter substrate-binding protein n=1 Tax=Clostridium tyrobutyricum TaxID=1519 RepID=UPI001C3911C3|nr:ABC transporter substrate-binding protein [Clostridium tyrobutyricum]MBV4428927.1 ABC transporter substrate-binding protein [Clostridium tyrobutyricum]MBV4444795.1 ABC transporter substrate-binding protein [Clostridium tyrobutyricum]
MKIKKICSIILSTFLLFSITGCGGSTGKDSSKTDTDKELTIVDWGGVYSESRKKVNYEPFEKKYGVKINIVSPIDNGKLKSIVESGNKQWDIANVMSYFAIQAGNDGLLEKLDFNVIDTKGIDKKFISDWSVGSDTFSTAIGYNKNDFSQSNHPKTWGEFWNLQKYPQARTLEKDPQGTLEAALLANGVKPENLYPLDLDRAFKSLDKIKPNVKQWWTTGAQAPTMLASSEVGLAAAWNGRIVDGKKKGQPIEIEYNQALVSSESWVVPKDAPHKKLAMEFINFASQAEHQAEFSKLIDYGPTNSEAYKYLSEDDKKRLGIFTDNSVTQIIVDSEYWGKNYNKVNDQFQKWLLQ